ncbi:MAG TPA: bifunctional 4-hydroxy-2-oxoglutarate aldolase/2-dehydro-3-deoxy-phosphogluconate aldolase [Acidobacteriota bacterium]|nr:bifunctional 4-hydroxy-2-oxoglutarate aldolase/2-dehydro-3-deoxy-phosphogluconate aldolase [Acidobacteriota bacterium]
MTNKTLVEVRRLGIFPIIVINEAARAVPIGQALLDGGLPCAEVTFRTAAAADSIRMLADKFPEMLLGAGTVLTVSQADEAISAGVRFIVTPGFNPRVVDYCIERGIDIYPGVCTPTDIEMALERNLTTVKFFPAEAIGGIPYLKAISAPYRMMHFIPTGGINYDNLIDYLSLPSVAACGGSWMVRKNWIEEENFAAIQQEVKRSVEAVRSLQETQNA